MDLDRHALETTLAAARRQLLALRLPGGHWEGRLSSSALSTATAVCALAIVDRKAHAPLIGRGLHWLARSANSDGGWGDTVLSKSNLSTTALVWSALAAAGAGDECSSAISGAESWIAREIGGTDPNLLAAAIADRYGRDRTFSAPILTMCALAGRLGPPEVAWRLVPALPFELAACPHRLWKWLRLPVVSYALPALIAIGQVKFRHDPPRNPLWRLLRRLSRRRTLDVLRDIQPPSGGFLEATPLTSFVVMSLAAAGLAAATPRRPGLAAATPGQAGAKDHPAVARGVEFLIASARPDGSWPIDTNLATWVTTLSVNALAVGGNIEDHLARDDRRAILGWLIAQQASREHPYTHAAPGGWAWTDLPGGVTDADDTAGALLALRNLLDADRGGTSVAPREGVPAAAAGAKWLADLQNRDGGIPTFCRGWGTLPFDRSGPDLTAHALAAWSCWLEDLPADLKRQVETAMQRAVAYLAREQRGDGGWSALWFGNEHAPGEQNLTYGTARVVTGLLACPRSRTGGFLAHREDLNDMVARGIRWLLSARNGDGGWGGAPATPSSIEETALATDALATFLIHHRAGGADESLAASVESAISAGVPWIVRNTSFGKTMNPSPIGFYFAKLWYFEELYPLIFTVSALERVSKAMGR